MILDNVTQQRFTGLDARLADLVKEVAKRIDVSIPEMEFRISEGKRTLEQQKQKVVQGFSKTLKSYHLTGKAVDLYIKKSKKYPNGTFNDKEEYRALANLFISVGKEKGLEVEWGGSWNAFGGGDIYHIQINN